MSYIPANPNGQANSANSAPVVLASDQSVVPTQPQGNVASGVTDSGNPVKVGLVYHATQPTVSDGQRIDAQADSQGNQMVNMAVKLDQLNDAVSAYEKGWTPVNLTASGEILSAPGVLKGFFVNSTSSGTVRIADSTGSGAGYLGGVITPAAGQFYQYPAMVSNGCYITVTGTIDVTFFVRSGTQA